MDKPPSIKHITGSRLGYMDNNPNLIISIVDLKKNNSIKKNFTYFDKYSFVVGACFPQGQNTTQNKFTLKDGTESYYHCKNEDYKKIINKYISIFQNFENINNEIIEINKNIKNNEFSLKNIVPFFILIIPGFISLFLFIFRNISIKKKENVIMIQENDEAIKEEDDDDNNNNLINNNNGNKIIKNIKILPKWFKLLNEFFSLEINSNELFNYDFNEENKINLNNKGIIYIKGIIGISILLTILGQLFLIFFNIPMKYFGIYQFQELISNVAYIFIFIGLRYSPRVLFSCSGYTLTYKYLSFIDKGTDYYFIKFFFFHFYKYIILLLFVFFLRYSLYDIIYIFFKIKPMWKIFNQQELKKPVELFEFLFNLFNLGFIFDIINIFSTDNDSKYSHDLFDYYWMPFNEIFFYIFGVILISLGNKLKIRIDYIIISLILIIAILKIIIYYCFLKNKDIYTTLYYYIFDYGRIMLNPIFNLSFFLIGMYFGLINYSLQKGITQKIKNNPSKNDTNNNSETNSIISEIRHISFSFNDIDDENSSRNSVMEISNNKKLNILKENDNDNQIDNINENKRYSINGLNSRHLSLVSKKKNNYIKETESMPFLKSAIKFIEWHRKESLNLFFIFLLVFFFLFIIILSILNIIFIFYFDITIDNKNEDNNYNNIDKFNEKLLLEGFISNKLLNCIYLFDIELFVIFIQWGFFIFYMKGQYFVIDFLSHNYWSFFIKSYFSFLLVCNPVILFIFYQSETLVKLNILNICLYYSINLVFILIMTIIVSIFIELPLKKISKYIVRREKYLLNLEENEDEFNEINNDDDEKQRIKK